jgi:ABC-type sugar transport system substrate-binding protein
VSVRSTVLPAAGAVPASDLAAASGVLATDERAAAVLLDAVARGRGRGPFVAVGATADEAAALRSGDVDALVTARPAELGARVVHLAVVARALNPRLVPRTVRLDPVTLTRANVDTKAGREATYP